MVRFSSLFLLFQAATLIFASPTERRSLATTAWDYIVVGSGPAGIITASRLSENTAKNVLLLEGGGPSYYVTGGRERPAWLAGTSLSRVDVPGLYLSIFSNPSSLTCGNNVNAFGGCTVGGSSAINAGLFFEPPASDFDSYFPAGWKHADLVPSINRLYATQPSSDVPSQDKMQYLQSGYIAAKNWIVAKAGFTELSINANAARKNKVFGHPVYDYNNAQRGGPAISYMQKALTRSNFHLQSGAWVQRVVRNGNTATGVVANVSGVLTTYSLSAKGRVIVSGGALKSPELLMKSGIGDPAVLERLQKANKLGGIPATSWINNTAVGAKLFDNPNTFIELSSPNFQSYVYSYDNPPASDKALYLQHRSGPYSFASEISVFWDTVKRADGSLAGMQGTIGTAGYSGYQNSSTVTLNIYGTSGLKSTGKVVLDSNFVPGQSGVYYSNPQDAQDIATFIRRIFDALPGTGITPLNIPQSATQAQIAQYITTPSAYAVGQVNHWSSSCRIGACVDTNTIVVGMKNLHVVDGSIVAPLTVNPQMGIMIAAERASELIQKLG
ncbi:oxygen-dependent choline dehydrogenase [Physcia stellaris]|nr:oxygen-dependent choline dehydrogenase [Physcia stellaris]